MLAEGQGATSLLPVPVCAPLHHVAPLVFLCVHGFARNQVPGPRSQWFCVAFPPCARVACQPGQPARHLSPPRTEDGAQQRDLASAVDPVATTGAPEVHASSEASEQARKLP